MIAAAAVHGSACRVAGKPAFERRGLISTRRGQLTMVDRAGIEQVAGSFYGIPEAELKRLMGDTV